jgi:hypothetical protein
MLQYKILNKYSHKVTFEAAKSPTLLYALKIQLPPVYQAQIVQTRTHLTSQTGNSVPGTPDEGYRLTNNVIRSACTRCSDVRVLVAMPLALRHAL